MDNHELKTALELKCDNNLEALIIEKLERAGIKSASHITTSDEPYSRKRMRSSKNAPALFGIPLICKEQPKNHFTLDNTIVSLPK